MMHLVNNKKNKQTNIKFLIGAFENFHEPCPIFIFFSLFRNNQVNIVT